MRVLTQKNDNIFCLILLLNLLVLIPSPNECFNIVSPFSLSVHVKPLFANLKLGADLNPFLIYSFLTLLPLLGKVLTKRRDDPDNTDFTKKCRLARACVLGAELGSESLSNPEDFNIPRNYISRLVTKETLHQIRGKYRNEFKIFSLGFYTSSHEMCQSIFKYEMQSCMDFT